MKHYVISRLFTVKNAGLQHLTGEAVSHSTFSLDRLFPRPFQLARAIVTDSGKLDSSYFSGPSLILARPNAPDIDLPF